ncbi:hypothetical protein L1987_87338 [Smallanthus sonchifolius]|nr:hypothetical protein L1987_87338 [Smallanthus sonchifolius]
MASIEESTCKNGFSKQTFFRFVVGLVFKTCGNMDLDVSDITFSWCQFLISDMNYVPFYRLQPPLFFNMHYIVPLLEKTP